ncbi:innner membrane protein [Salmonella enterica subsp. enterica]|uniref:Innner membrane protein n=1 Tax=Salmonella enterica I TaxID=59201 RepID=A0A379X1E6_SALET|nr:innner membrane protein [Salmonella enterica subsp. enterica]
MLAMLTLFPFAVVIGYLIAPVFTDMILFEYDGECAGRRGRLFCNIMAR